MDSENAPMTDRGSPVDQQERPGGGTDGLRSRESSGPRATVQAAVKEAVAIAAGKKGMGQSDDDDGGGKSRSNMLCYLYWLLVMLIVGLISFTVWLSVQLARRHSLAILSQNGKYGEKEPFSFDDLFNATFQPKAFEVKWMPGNGDSAEDTYVYKAVDGSLMIHRTDTNITETIFDKSIFEGLKSSSYHVSSNLRYVLLKYDVKWKWRHSFTAKYAIYDRQAKSGTSRLLEFPNDPLLSGRALQYAVWAPTSTALLFAYGNNIYYQRDPFSQAVQLTFTGDSKYIFNGVSDWLYEEEILSSHVAHWWSADSRYICYAAFNDTRVPLFRFPYYGPRSDLYGDIIEFAYPKAGDTNPDSNTKISLHLVDTDHLNTKHLAIYPPQEFKTVDHYVTQVSWADGQQLAIVWSNRAQNKSITTICGIPSTSFVVHCHSNYYRTVSDGWLDPLPPMVFLQGGTSYATILAQSEADTGTWNHLAIISSTENEYGQVKYLSRGQQEVKSIAGYDSSKNLIYFLSTGGDPKQRHLFRANIETTVTECITCGLSDECQYVSASFSPSAKHYVLGCLGPGVPTYTLFKSDGSFSALVENNTELKAVLNTKAMPRREFMEVPIGGGLHGWAEVWTPPSATTDEKGRRYPLLVNTYGGPGSQKVTERFQLGFETYLASSEDIVYASLDGRGSASRGNRFKYLLYRKLGVVEVEDQLLAGLFFKTLEYVDPAKTAIWGWSYGGFVTGHAVANGTDVYPCGISGAALSDRRFYDTAHSERYMGFATPNDNLQGYELTDVMKKVEFFRNKKFLIVHGTADDNVHFASSAHLVKTLTDADIQFRFQLYTDLNHYFLGTNRHLFHLITDFLKNECYSYFWKHETQSWVVDKMVKKEKFRIKQFCV